MMFRCWIHTANFGARGGCGQPTADRYRRLLEKIVAMPHTAMPPIL